MEKEFQESVLLIKTKTSVSNDDKLKLYGLYKQATIGNNTNPVPSFFYPTERAKWFAWNENQNLPSDDAKRMYIEFVRLLLK